MLKIGGSLAREAPSVFFNVITRLNSFGEDCFNHGLTRILKNAVRNSPRIASLWRD